MKDSEFDRLFREKSEGFDYQFEEGAWGLMEKKLRKRDRFVFMRNASAVLLLFLFAGAGFYFFDQDESKVLTSKRKNTDKLNKGLEDTHKKTVEVTENQKNKINQTAENKANTSIKISQKVKPNVKSVNRNIYVSKSENLQNGSGGISKSLDESDLDIPFSLMVEVRENQLLAGNLTEVKQPAEATKSNLATDVLKRPLKPRFSFTLSAGPDFSSISSIAGRKGNINGGLLFSASVNKFSLSTGARYGAKNYDADGLNYQQPYNAGAGSISSIDAVCDVLEIPLQLSYAIFESRKRKIELNTGLSSYLMLKEKYQFNYNYRSGNYMLEKTNANQSYFGVMSFSAAYKFKPVTQKIQFGIEPYVKLPLAGVGEGKVYLKSSGISLNMTYEISRQH